MAKAKQKTKPAGSVASAVVWALVSGLLFSELIWRIAGDATKGLMAVLVIVLQLLALGMTWRSFSRLKAAREAAKQPLRQGFALMLAAIVLLSGTVFTTARSFLQEKPDLITMQFDAEDAALAFREYRQSGSEESFQSGVESFRLYTDACENLLGSNAAGTKACAALLAVMDVEPERIVPQLDAVAAGLDELAKDPYSKAGYEQLVQVQTALQQ